VIRFSPNFGVAGLIQEVGKKRRFPTTPMLSGEDRKPLRITAV
jgi:hypothetical protein